MNLGRYLAVLRTPGVARVALFATTGRLPFAIVPLSVVLLMREEGYQYGQIGLVVGAEALAVGVTAGFVGRLVDRVGRRQVILVTGAVTALFLCAEAVGNPLRCARLAADRTGGAPRRDHPTHLRLDARAVVPAGAR